MLFSFTTKIRVLLLICNTCCIKGEPNGLPYETLRTSKHKPKNNPFLYGLQRNVDGKYQQFSTKRAEFEKQRSA